jgi:phosphate transport system substrate-binding protein
MLVLTDAAGRDAYSVSATVFVIMYKKPKNPERAAVALDFFKWTHLAKMRAERIISSTIYG